MDDYKELIKLYREHYYLPDEGIIPLICAVIISNKMDGDAVWLMLVGAPSGGKSEIINTTLGVNVLSKPFVHQVSTLTSNAFLSGMVVNGKETSLLRRIGLAGVIAMKDFTSILSLGQDTQTAVIGQMREIYDGHLTKETGTGKKLEWGPNGKINLLGGVTEAIYMVEEKFGSLGPRWVNYVLKDQDPEITTRIAIKNEHHIKKVRQKMREAFGAYIEHMIDRVPKEPIELSEDYIDSIIRLCTFVSIARSPVTRNFRGEMVLSTSAEMPMRMTKQCTTLARTLTYMNKGDLTEALKGITYKVALDCIPKQRMIALSELSRHETLTTAGLASKIDYPTATVKMWLEDLNVRGICKRNKKNVGHGDSWEIVPKYRDIMVKFKGIEYIGGNLVGEGSSEDDSYEEEGFDPHADTDAAHQMQVEKESAEKKDDNDFGPF